ncbi:hypothetical protein AgCh_034300 [Apium graveolens]
MLLQFEGGKERSAEEFEKLEMSLPKGNQINAANVATTTSSDQFTQMHQQINQLSQMMSYFVGKGLNSPEDHLAGMVTSIANLVVNSRSTYAWLIDTGTTDHMCCSLSLLTDIKPLAVPINLALPIGATIFVTKTGTFTINPYLVLHNVLFVP